MSYGPDDVSGLRYPNKKWVLFDTSETASIDFSQVYETGIHTLKLNVSQSRTFVKYNRAPGEAVPSSVAALTTKSDEYNYIDFVNLMTGSEWSGG